MTFNLMHQHGRLVTIGAIEMVNPANDEILQSCIEQYIEDGLDIVERANRLTWLDLSEYNMVSAEVIAEGLREAQEIIAKFASVCDEEQLSQVDGVRQWLELFGKESQS